MSTQTAFAAELVLLGQQIDKVGVEISGLKTAIVDLEALVNAGGPISAEVTAQFAVVKSKFQTIDDLVPDAA